jgi:hypothetical protein
MVMPPKLPVGIEPLSNLRCPWCSEPLPADATEQCPACHANLIPHPDERLPGLTEVEPVAASKTRRPDPARRSKLLAWISGDVDLDAAVAASERTASPEALDLPSREVRREIWRLTLEAEGLAVSDAGDISISGDESEAESEDGSELHADPAAPAAAAPAAAVPAVAAPVAAAAADAAPAVVAPASDAGPTEAPQAS